MSKHPKEPHLFAVHHVLDGGEEPMAVIRAATTAEAREHFLANTVRIERLTPGRAYAIASYSRMEVQNAREEYAEFDEAPQPEFDFIDASGRTLPDDIPRPTGFADPAAADTNEA